MANEIKITKTIVYANGSLKYTYQPASINLPQTTQGFVSKTVEVNTSAEEDLTLTEIGTAGVIVLHSLEATTTGNYVSYGPKSLAASTTGVDSILKIARLNPKEIHTLHLNSTSVLRWQANTAAVRVHVICFEA